MSCCPIKLAALQNLDQGLELMQNRLAEVERHIVSITAEIAAETADEPRTLISRSMRANGFRERYLDNILAGITADSAMPDIKASRLAELTMVLNRITAQRDEIALLVNALVAPVVPAPQIDEIKSEDQILAELQAQVASLEEPLN